MPTLRILGNDDVRAAISTDTALELARQTLRDQAAGRVSLSVPSAMSLDAPVAGGPHFKFKAAAVAHLNASGVRLLGRSATPGIKAPNYCVVFDHESAGLSGLVPDYWLSRIRTAAFGAAVAERLVKPGPLVVTLFGAGAIAREIVPMLERVLQVAELRVHSRRPESTAAFVAAVAPQSNLAIKAEPDRGGAIDGADLIITLTESPTPLIKAGELKAGAVVCSMGSHNEVEFGVFAEAQRFVVDDADYAAEMGDGGAWIKQGHLTHETFRSSVDALACEIVAGSKQVRLDADDRIVALLQGMAIGDIAFAAYALQQAERLGRGTVVDLP